MLPYHKKFLHLAVRVNIPFAGISKLKVSSDIDCLRKTALGSQILVMGWIIILGQKKKLVKAPASDFS